MRIIMVLLVMMSCSARADFLASEQRESLIQAAFANFWGKAKTQRGVVVQPHNETERTTLPISKFTANHVISVGELSAIAEWCNLDWKSHFLSLTAKARQQGFNEKQLAFIGLLHGITQGHVHSAIRTRPCASEQKKNAATLLDKSPVRQAIPK